MSHLRHQQQRTVLVQLLYDRQLLTDGAVVVELGAGKAGLSRELLRDARHVSTVTAVVLVDNEAFKGKGR